MSRKDFIKEFDKFIEGKNINSDDDFDNVFDEFMKQQKIIPYEALSEDDAEDSYDYLELAESALTKKQALKYAKKAVQLDPDNIDAQITVARLTANTNEALLKKLRELIDAANIKMEADGWFSDEYIGEFWGFHETRPYMRLRTEYLDVLIDCSMLGLAVKECKDLLRLCENDNLGIRYRLMHLFVYFEDEKSALELLSKYDEKSTMFLLPLSILYYKLGDLNKSTKYLKELKSVNKDTVKFFDTVSKECFDDSLDEMGEYGYRPFTIEEFAVELDENAFLFIGIPQYFRWATKKLSTNEKR